MGRKTATCPRRTAITYGRSTLTTRPTQQKWNIVLASTLSILIVLRARSSFFSHPSSSFRAGEGCMSGVDADASILQSEPLRTLTHKSTPIPQTKSQIHDIRSTSVNIYPKATRTTTPPARTPPLSLSLFDNFSNRQRISATKHTYRQLFQLLNVLLDPSNVSPVPHTVHSDLLMSRCRAPRTRKSSWLRPGCVLVPLNSLSLSLAGF